MIANGMLARYQTCRGRTCEELLLHLLQDLVLAALLDQPVVAQGLTEGNPGEEEHQQEHSRDRDVVRLEQDREKLMERRHGSPVQRRTTAVNRRPPLAQAGLFGLRARNSVVGRLL